MRPFLWKKIIEISIITEDYTMAQINLSEGPITKNMLRFAFPMICGNMLQQLYNVVDTLIVGKYLGTNALAAVEIGRAHV